MLKMPYSSHVRKFIAFFVKIFKKNMKKVLQLMFSVCIMMFGFSQDLKPVAQKIANQKTAKTSFVKFSPFTKVLASKNASHYEKAASGVSVMKLKSSQLQSIVNEKPDAMEMSFPFENGEVTVELVKTNIFTPDFKVNTDKGEVSYTPGVYYQGIVKGDNNSLVAFSFFEDDVVGIASIDNIGNIVLGKATGATEDFVSYNDVKLKEKNPFTCDADVLPSYSNHPDKQIGLAKKTTLTSTCLRMYYEIGYGIYTGNGSNTTTTLNRVTAWFNNVKTLYNNDGMNLAFSSSFIWTTADSGTYSGQPGDILSTFRTRTTSFNGDAAQLLRTPATTSVGYVDALCSTYRFSYCGMNASQNTSVPTYSWNVMVMAHELGHNVASPHTHACYWNESKTAIDGCGPAAGYDEGCAADLPTGGGTIMSYCHLTSAGINFTKGFGDQVGTLMREAFETSACLSSDCTVTCATTVANLTVAASSVTNTGAVATITDSSSSEWKYQVSTSDGAVVQSGTTQNKTLTLSNLLPGTFYRVSVGTSCSPAFQKTVLFLTGDNWCGKTVTDSGGENATYSNSENWTKTFYPDSADQKLKITFEAFDLEEGYDYLTVRNGTAGSPVFTGGVNITGNTLPPTFESTHATGAITITFRSDATARKAGFKAVLSCTSLATEETNAKNAISVTPNPVKNQFKINGNQKLENVIVFDNSGKIVKQYDAEAMSKNNFDVSKLAAGTYIVNIKTSKGVVSKKLIKQ